MARQTSLTMVALWAGVASLVSGATLDGQCSQRYTNDFRQDETDCRRFYVCYLGRLVPYACNPGSVFEETSGSCVPAHSQYDMCSIRQQCRAAGPGPVAHPSQCNQYYVCGTGPSQSRNGRDLELRECPHPLVFSERERRCVPMSPGVCGARQEPLDACDYKVNQCDGHANCVPCNVRFPSCRGLPDGPNAWTGREGSPYFAVCRQQRVMASGMCEQKEAVFVFDPRARMCVKQEEAIHTPGVSGLPQQGSGNISIQTPHRLVLPPGFLPLSAPHPDQEGQNPAQDGGTRGQGK